MFADPATSFVWGDSHVCGLLKKGGGSTFRTVAQLVSPSAVEGLRGAGRRVMRKSAWSEESRQGLAVVDGAGRAGKPPTAGDGAQAARGAAAGHAHQGAGGGDAG